MPVPVIIAAGNLPNPPMPLPDQLQQAGTDSQQRVDDGGPAETSSQQVPESAGQQDGQPAAKAPNARSTSGDALSATRGRWFEQAPGLVKAEPRLDILLVMGIAGHQYRMLGTGPVFREQSTNWRLWSTGCCARRSGRPSAARWSSKQSGGLQIFLRLAMQSYQVGI